MNIMIIDFHTHFFNDKIAARTLEKLAALSGNIPQTDGTLSGTVELMNKCGVDKSVLMTIATKPAQVTSINNWAISVSSDRIIPFGTLHPDFEEYGEELQRLKDSGIKGIKLHPDYQAFFIDEERMYTIYESIISAGMYILFHTGYDIGLGNPIHATAAACRRIVDRFGGERFVFAHMGGHNPDEFKEYLMGQNTYIDTAYSLSFYDDVTAKELILGHGADKVLFATDLPWENPSEVIAKINALDIDDVDKQLIFSGNARRILGL